jgi:hypothetical protein
MMGTGFFWLRIVLTVEDCCEHDNEPSGSIKCWGNLEQLSDWRLLKKSSGSMNLVS